VTLGGVRMNSWDSELWNIQDWYRTKYGRGGRPRATGPPALHPGQRAMLRYTIRRLLFAVPTLLVISFIIFALLDLAPGDPTANLPMTIDAQTREQIRLSLGLGEPFHVRYIAWLHQVFVNEPLNILHDGFGISSACASGPGRPARRSST